MGPIAVLHWFGGGRIRGSISLFGGSKPIMRLLSNDPAAGVRLAMDHLPQGVVVFDAGLRLVASNRHYNALLALPEDLVRPGTALFDIALFLAERGDLGPGDAARLAIERINLLASAPLT